MARLLLCVGLAVLCGPPAARGDTIITVAGGGNLGDNGPPTSASLAFPTGIAVDAAGDLLIADSANSRVREVVTIFGAGFTSTIMTTVAGSIPGVPAFIPDGGLATSSQLSHPTGVALDAAGNVYIVDQADQRVRKVDASTRIITSVAGTALGGFSGDGGLATAAMLHNPSGIAFDAAGNLYIADRDNHRVRRVDASTRIIATIAGTGTGGFSGDGGLATGAQLNSPTGVAFDAAGNLLIADSGNHRVRRVDASTRIVTTVAGTGTGGFNGDGGTATGAQLNSPTGVALDAAGNLLIADSGNHRIRKVVTLILAGVTSRLIFTVAGTGTPGFSGDGGPATSARLNNPTGVYADLAAGNLYIADTNNHRIRKMLFATGIMTTVAGNGNAGGDNGPATSAQLRLPTDVAVERDTNALIVADLDNHRVRKVDALTGTITTVAGTGMPGFNGDNIAATSARLNDPAGVAVDDIGNLYIADSGNHRVRSVDVLTGVIATVAGTGASGFNADNIVATSAQLQAPSGVASDSAGNLYIADSGNHRIRKVAGVSGLFGSGTGIITTVAGTGTAGFNADNIPATSALLNDPTAVAVDANDNLYIADRSNHRIRMVAASTGIITTVAGTGTPSFGVSPDGGLAISTPLAYPGGVVVDSTGNLYIADSFDDRIRHVAASTGIITTVAGTGGSGFSGDDGPPTSATFNNPQGIAVDSGGNVFIADQTNSRIRAVVAPIVVAPTLRSVPNLPGATGASTDPTFDWSAIPGATGYRLMVIAGSGTLPTNPATDTCAGGCVINTLVASSRNIPFYTPSFGVLKPGTTYRWQVKALGRLGPGPWSSVGSFTTRPPLFTFRDDPLVPRSSLIRAVHIMELRAAINIRRAQWGLPAYVFADATLDSTKPVKTVHVTQLRAALTEAYPRQLLVVPGGATGQSAPVWAETIASGVTMKASHLAELRAAVEALEPSRD